MNILMGNNENALNFIIVKNNIKIISDNKGMVI